MKKICVPISILIFIFTTNLSFSQTKKVNNSFNIELEKNILTIIKAFQQKDSTTLQKYIDTTIRCYEIPPYGTIHNLHKIGSVFFKSYDFLQSSFGLFSTRKKVIQFSDLPEYDCNKSKWNKKGLYANRNNRISTILQTLIKDNFETYNTKDLEHMLEIENSSYWVIYAPDDTVAISFLITYLNNKYYLTAYEIAPLYCDI
jgi:uncharacterized membrane protein YheB (UPF0754 family)